MPTTRALPTLLALLVISGAAAAGDAYSYDEAKEPFVDPGVKEARKAAQDGSWEQLGQGLAEPIAEVDSKARAAGQQLGHVAAELKTHLGLELHDQVREAIAARDAAALDRSLVLMGANLVRLKLANNLADKLEPYRAAAARNASCQLIYDELLKPVLLAFDLAAGEAKGPGVNARAVAALESLRAMDAMGGATGLARVFNPPAPDRYREAASALLAALHDGIPAFETVSLDYGQGEGEEASEAEGSREAPTKGAEEAPPPGAAPKEPQKKE